MASPHRRRRRTSISTKWTVSIQCKAGDERWGNPVPGGCPPGLDAEANLQMFPRPGEATALQRELDPKSVSS